MKINLKVLYNLNIKERLIIALVILSLTGYLIYTLIIPPVFYRYKIARRQFYVQQHLIESKEQKTENLLQLKDNFEDLKRSSFKKRNMFFTDEQALDLLNNLDRWTNETGNQLEKITPKSTEIVFDSKFERETRYKNNLVEITVKGEYNSLLNLFKRFAVYEKLLGVTQIDLKQTKEDPLLLDARVILNIYILDKK